MRHAILKSTPPPSRSLALLLLLFLVLHFPSQHFSHPSYFSTYNFYLPETELVLYQVCMERWPKAWHRFAYTLALMFVQYVIPVSTILVTHGKIIRIVKVRNIWNCRILSLYSPSMAVQVASITEMRYLKYKKWGAQVSFDGRVYIWANQHSEKNFSVAK
jgi:hypothetical protein